MALHGGPNQPPIGGRVGLSAPAGDRFFVDLEFFYRWVPALATVNSGKRGAPFAFPDLFFEYLACVRVRTHLDYRSLGGFAARLLDEARTRMSAQGSPDHVLQRLRPPHFTQLRRRIAAIRLDVERARTLSTPEPVHLLLNVDGVRVVSYASWVRDFTKRVSRGWIRIDVEPPRPAAVPVVPGSAP